MHRKCMAQWQMRCVGKTEETCCRFCDTKLPDWKLSVIPENLRASMDAAIGMVQLTFDDLAIAIEFKDRMNMSNHCTAILQWVLKLSEHELKSIQFSCHEPFTQTDLNIIGIDNISVVEFCSRAHMVLMKNK